MVNSRPTKNQSERWDLPCHITRWFFFLTFACNYPDLRPVKLRPSGCIKSSDPKNSLSACQENSEREKYDNIVQSVLTKDCFKESCSLFVDTMSWAEFAERGKKHPKVISLQNRRNSFCVFRRTEAKIRKKYACSPG